MATETLPPAASPDSRLPALSRHASIDALSICTVDAIDDIGHLLQAYRCVENLLMPASGETRTDFTDSQFHALMVVLNDALDQRIRRAKRKARRVQTRSHQRRLIRPDLGT